MEILRRYCMGGDNVGFQIISDQSQCLRSIVSGRANYEDEFYSVSTLFCVEDNFALWCLVIDFVQKWDAEIWDGLDLREPVCVGCLL